MSIKSESILIFAVGAALAGFAGCSKSSQSDGTSAATGTDSSSSTDTSADTSTDSSTETSTSGDPGTQAGTIALSTIDGLPSVLDPVLAFDASVQTAEAEAARNFDSLAISTGLTTLAKTGASLGSSVADLNSAFEAASSPSKAMCDTVNQSMKFIFEAGSPDFMSCIIKGAGLSKDDALYTGTDKIYRFVMSMEGKTRQYLVKLNVQRDGGVIKRFSFHSCSDDSGDWKQQHYFLQQIQDGVMSIDSKMSGPTGSLSHLQLKANVDDQGKLRGLKTMEYRDSNLKETYPHYKHAEITQSPSNILYNGFETGGGGGIQYYSFYELLDANVEGQPYAVTKLAVGDGAALVKSGSDGVAQGWNGDTLSVNEEEPRLAKVEGQESKMMAVDTVATEDYKGDEVFDCAEGDAVEVQLELEMAKACMARFEIDQEGEGFCSGLSY